MIYEGIEIKPIPGYRENYADCEGNVYQVKGEVVKKLKPHDDHRGYLIVGCKRDSTNKPYPLKVHHAVLMAFVGPRPSETAIARHLDDNSFNNKLSNLKWGTTQENQKDKLKNGRSSVQDKRKTSMQKKSLLCRMYNDGYTIDELSLLTGWRRGLVEMSIQPAPDCVVPTTL